MTVENIFNELGGLDPELIMKAAPKEGVSKKKRSGMIKWLLIAASLCFIITISLAVIPSILNPTCDLDSNIAFVAFSYDTESSKIKPSVFISATFPTYMNTDYNDSILDVPVGLATKRDYANMSAGIPERTIFTIETENILIDGKSNIFKQAHDITDPKYQCIDKVGNQILEPYRHPNHYEFHYFDFSDLKSGDSGEIKFTFTNYYGENSYEGAVVRIYYAVKGNIIGFSAKSAEEATERAEKEYSKRYSFFAAYLD